MLRRIAYDKIAETMIHFGRSASKHEISRDRIAYVIGHCGLPFESPPPPGSPYTAPRIAFLGDDANGVALEVLAQLTDEDDLYVFHARRSGSHFRTLYEEALPCRVV